MGSRLIWDPVPKNGQEYIKEQINEQFVEYHGKPAHINVNKKGKTNNDMIQKINQQTSYCWLSL